MTSDSVATLTQMNEEHEVNFANFLVEMDIACRAKMFMAYGSHSVGGPISLPSVLVTTMRTSQYGHAGNTTVQALEDQFVHSMNGI